MPGPSGGRLCAKTDMGAVTPSRSAKDSQKILPLTLCLTVQSPLLFSNQSLASAPFGTHGVNFRFHPKLCAKHTSAAVPRQRESRQITRISEMEAIWTNHHMAILPGKN
jgi:hypothetical protein